jgi:hypothetical protein
MLLRGSDSPSESALSWGLIWSGGIAAALLAVGFNVFQPLAPSLAALCDVAGIAASVMFIGLADGA